jgi:glycosyltransferase involved in cell wall biosynthesis
MIANANAGFPDGRGERMPTVWFDTELLLAQADAFRNPTGIERVSLELFAQAQHLYAGSGRAGFLRLSFYSGRPRLIDYTAIAGAYAHNSGGAAPPWLQRIGDSLRSAVRYAMPIVRDARSAMSGIRSFESCCRPGDVLVCLSDFWFNRRYVQHVAAAKKAYGLRFALLIHDLAPIIMPQHFPPQDSAKFARSISAMVELSDLVFVYSDYSHAALLDFAARHALHVPPVAKLRFGAGFRKSGAAVDATPAMLEQVSPRFVLFVSTIESRKNHILLLRVWRRLIDAHGRDSVPDLVFVGSKMWQSASVLAALAADAVLSGKVHVFSGMSDDILDHTYRRCLFTVYPSLYEGWGLPVAESLLHGKFCVASNATSLPEVGGEFVDYFDPRDDDDAFAKIERVIIEPGYLAAREDRLRTGYVAPSWSDCMHSLMSHAAALSPRMDKSGDRPG